MGTFIAVFSKLEDPRASNAQHNLLEILFIALTAVLCGAESCADMADFGRAKEGLLRPLLRLEHGIPSHDTFSRVFRLLDPEAFEAAFRRFMATFAGVLGGVVAIDGKAVRGAYERGGRTTPLHLVNVWAAEARLAVAQRKAPGRNEVAGALEALKLVSLTGCIVTTDALHCHRDMAQTILERGAEYVLALKENQSALFAAVLRTFRAVAHPETFEQKATTNHGRTESRRASVISDPALGETLDFPGLCAVGRLDASRHAARKEAEVTTRYFLLSSPLSAEKLLDVVRTHWSIENRLHWVLDVVFDEDRARNRKDHGPENLALLRKLALNLLRSHPDKASIRRKIKRAGWDDAFLLSLFAHMR